MKTWKYFYLRSRKKCRWSVKSLFLFQKLKAIVTLKQSEMSKDPLSWIFCSWKQNLETLVDNLPTTFSLTIRVFFSFLFSAKRNFLLNFVFATKSCTSVQFNKTNSFRFSLKDVLLNYLALRMNIKAFSAMKKLVAQWKLWMFKPLRWLQSTK